MMVRVCWCRDCQYFAAGSGTVNVVYPAASLEVEGEIREIVSTAESGNTMRRHFCPNCGTPLFSASDARPHLVIVRAGALDDPSAIKPSMTIWTDSAPPYACIDASIPSTPRQPPPL